MGKNNIEMIEEKYFGICVCQEGWIKRKQHVWRSVLYSRFFLPFLSEVGHHKALVGANVYT